MRKLLRTAAVGLSLACAVRLHAQLERAQSRSMTISRHGIVATSQTLASAAGSENSGARWVGGGCRDRRKCHDRRRGADDERRRR